MRFPSGTVSGVLIGATIGSLLMLIGYIARDRQQTPVVCRDVLRFLSTTDEYVPCPTPGSVLQLVEIGNRPAAVCNCSPVRSTRTGGTELL